MELFLFILWVDFIFNEKYIYFFEVFFEFFIVVFRGIDDIEVSK